MNYIELFQTLGFPVAVCVVLFTIMIFFFKKTIAIIQKIMDDNAKQEAENRQYLQQSNADLAKIISLNTQALNRFSYLMGIISKKFKNE